MSDYKYKTTPQLYEAIANELDEYIIYRLANSTTNEGAGFLFEGLREVAKISMLMRERAKRK